ncbi:EF-P 5-aminopentanol modification-associated protein YfmF [Ligilactobacillus salivarius]|uniref:EF-P 5-aminopentanol modification-associated protein YfmF n=2 Tax=Ligilactobacillus salivarius TaxID=1624 RepID=UPI0009DAC70F|nr:pitrilysin family protein [Ligilactobacillus salivarius]MDL1930282.1 insulinase family protein [Ligilactobacillus salivarius]MYU79593.1 insulinase family protein [Ligilactobacillus salivarius]MYV06517.1 insulinase family protein [Ligilactobacillus salivarius]MYV22230.1 insulinase family protein [Ligilactobacillus salivarius]MYY32189.1 insulinase family protein [Ligilactobacillus salivarius]
MRIELVKGVNLNIIPSKQFKTTRIFISFIKNIESKKELAERALLANYLEMCSQNYPTQIDIARKLSQMYGASFGSSVDRRGNYQLINFSIDYIEGKYLVGNEDLFSEVIEFLKEIIFNPLKVGENKNFDEETFTRQKNNTITYLKSIKEDKQAYATAKLRKLYFDNEIQQVPSFGESEDVEKLTISDLMDAYQKMLNTDRVEIMISGDVNTDEVINKFSVLPFKARNISRVSMSYTQEIKQEIVTQIDEEPLSQSKFDMAFRLPVVYRGDLHYAALVFNSLFGGSALSLLFTVVREKMSMAYYANSNFDPFRQLLVVQTGISYANKDKVQELILEQLERLKKGDFEDELLEQNKNNLISSYISRLDSQTSALLRAQSAALTGINVTIEEWLDNLQSVTKDDVMKVAKMVELQATYMLGTN